MKRSRTLDTSSSSAAAASGVCAEDSINFSPALAYAELVSTPLPASTCPRALLGSLAAEESRALASSAPARAARIEAAAAAAREGEASRLAAAAAVERAAALDARREAELVVGGGGALELGAVISSEAAAAAADAATAVLRDYAVGASAAAVAIITRGADKDGVELPPPTLRGGGSGSGGGGGVGGGAGGTSGRPLRGATSAAMYLSAEREAGADGAPPQRFSWRYPIDSAAANRALDPHLIAEAREVLKRPSWPDRAFPLTQNAGGSGVGSRFSRAVALAAQWDEAEADCEAIARLHMRTLDALEQQAETAGSF